MLKKITALDFLFPPSFFIINLEIIFWCYSIAFNCEHSSEKEVLFP